MNKPITTPKAERSHARSPADDGYFMPAEWAPHKRCWMMWPCRPGMWPDIMATKRSYVAVARAIRMFEPVIVAACHNDVHEARQMLGPAIEVVGIDIDDSWARDAGPCFLVNGKGGRAGASFRFNAWGGKYDPYDRDDAFSSAALVHAGIREYASDLIAEGGGVSVDGEGTVLTTLSCFPNANRNPDWTLQEIENELKAMLGARKVIWLPGNVEETETDGHVDGIAAFVKPGVVLVEDAGPKASPFYDIMRENLAALEGQTDATGRPLELVTIPEAADACSESDRFCRSYVNSYIANGGVVMPSYGVDADRVARDIFRSLYPDRQVLTVPIDDIAGGGGGIHCITQQEPAG